MKFESWNVLSISSDCKPSKTVVGYTQMMRTLGVAGNKFNSECKGLKEKSRIEKIKIIKACNNRLHFLNLGYSKP